MTPEQAAKLKALKQERDALLQQVTNVALTLSPALQAELHTGLKGLVAFILAKKRNEERP
jgi:hypothetical protein